MNCSIQSLQVLKIIQYSFCIATLTMDAGWRISHSPTLNTSLNCHPALDQSECPLMPANIWHLVETLRQTIMFLCFLLTTEQFRRRLPLPFIAELHMSHEQLFRP